MNKKDIIELVFSMLIVISLILFTKLRPFMIASVSGDSMEPTYKNRDIKILFKQKPDRNDVVVTKMPKEWDPIRYSKDVLIIKRAVAIPGDTLEIKNGIVYVNNKKIKDVNKYYTNLKDLTIKLKNSYFLMGDNTEVSFDSLRAYSLGDKDYLINEKDIVYSRKEAYNEE